jgi:hypothetical protein
MAELPTTEAFAAATAHVSSEAIAQQISCGSSAAVHLAAIERYIEAGYDHLILTQIGPEQDAFMEQAPRRAAARAKTDRPTGVELTYLVGRGRCR